MKKINAFIKAAFALLVISVLSSTNLFAQNDSMYIMKNRQVIAQYNVDTEIDSIIFYPPNASTPNSFTDPRDGYTYLITTIGTQIWMAENLKYLPNVNQMSDISQAEAKYYVYGYDGTDINNAKATDNYQTYGVLYNFEAAKSVCPTGWHTPSDEEWEALITFVSNNGHANEEGTALKSTNGWFNDGNGTDNYGFAAFPGGYLANYGQFDYITYIGYCWSGTEDAINSALYRSMIFNNGGVIKNPGYKDAGMSIRCIKD